MKKIVLAICLLLGVQSFAAEENYCSSEALNQRAEEYIAQSNKNGDELRLVKRAQAITFDLAESDSLVAQRRTIEAAELRNEQMYLQSLEVCK